LNPPPRAGGGIGRRQALGLGLALSLGPRAARAQAVEAGPFRIEAVESRVAAGGFPNTSGNPFRRTEITTYRVLHLGRPVPVPGGGSARAPWWEVRVLGTPAQPALLLMEAGAWLLTAVDDTPQLSPLAPRDGGHAHWQWLDAAGGQPGPVSVVGPAHRPQPLATLAAGRWLAVYARAVIDLRTLQVHRYWLSDSAVLEALQGFYPKASPLLAFSPGATQFVVAAARDRPGEADLERRFEHGLVAFDFQRQRGVALPVDLRRWRLANAQGIDAAFAQRAVAWRQLPDGSEQASLRDPAAEPWQGRLSGREMDSLSYDLQPVGPPMQQVLARFLVSEFGATLAPGSLPGLQQVGIDGLTLLLGFLRPQEQRLSLYYADDWQRRAAAHALIERIAKAFDARLAAGEHQALFIADKP
jgi:hypothetical protein